MNPMNMQIGRFWMDSLMRSRTYYGVTNQRVLIKSGVFASNLKSLDIRGLSDISLSERGDKTGTISFGTGILPFGRMFSSMAWWPGASLYMVPSFDMIPDAQRVYEIVRHATSAEK